MALATGAILVVLLSGCAPGVPVLDDPVAADLAAVDTFSSSGARIAPDRWWTAFGDAAVDTVVHRTLAGNLDLKAAWERLREADAAVRVAGGERWPLVTATLDGEMRRPETDPDGRLQLGLAASYEVDLWGRVGAQVAAERERARAEYADYRTVALSLSAEAVTAWFGLIEATTEHTVLEQQVATNAKALTLLEARLGTGLVSRTDVLRQRQLVEATREQALVADVRRRALQHRLAVLQGRAPNAAIDLAEATLPELPPAPRTGVPADLVRRRPDVQRAHHELAAADRDLAAAISARYPRLTLSASATTGGSSPSALFDDWIRSLAGGLLAPLFAGGELAAEVDRAEARRGQALYAYGQAVLEAFREVEDALVAEDAGRRRLTSLERQFAFAAETHRRLRQEYANGMAGFLDVLVARVNLQQLERDRLAARLRLLENRIALYRALAGGFVLPQPAPDRSEDR